MYNLFRIVCPLDDGVEDQDEDEDEFEQAKGCVCVCDERKVCSGRKMLKLGQLFNWASGYCGITAKSVWDYGMLCVCCAHSASLGQL